MPTIDSQLNRVLTFLGYGNVQGPVWFVGQEERLPPEADPAQHLLVRSLFPQTVDCRDAHAALGINHLHGLGGQLVAVQSTWRQMAYLMLCLEGRQLTLGNVAAYQAHVLGSSGGPTLVTELMPLPRGSAGAWPYGELFSDVYDSVGDYQRKVWPHRRALLRGALAQHRPKLVVCYGSPHQRFEELFPDHRFNAVEGTVFRAAFDAGRSVLLAPHFSPWYGRFPTPEFLNCAIGAALLAGLRTARRAP